MIRDITIVIPAYNEEKNIEAAIDSVKKALDGFVDYEMIVIDDGSRDRTASLANARSLDNPRLKVFSNDQNQGYGYSLLRGMKLSSKAYVSAFPGDNDASALSLRDMINAVEGVDMVISYMEGRQKRSLLRRIISKCFVSFLNALFGLKVKYYNGLFVFRTEVIRQLSIQSTGLAVIAECIVRMMKSGCTYQEIGFQHIGREAGQSTALKFKNISSVLTTVFILIRDIYFHPRVASQKICSTFL